MDFSDLFQVYFLQKKMLDVIAVWIRVLIYVKTSWLILKLICLINLKIKERVWLGI